jgi:CBS domain containing-hemolysin-like protein
LQRSAHPSTAQPTAHLEQLPHVRVKPQGKRSSHKPMNPLDAGLGLVAVVVLVLLNGFFVATEFSLVSVRRTRIDELVASGNRSAVVVQHALARLDPYIAATQLGITMASLALGWIGEPALAHLIEPLLGFLPANLAGATAHTLAVTLAFVVITTLHIVLGELAPKSIALQRPESTALWVTWPTTVFLKIFWPFIAVMNGAGNMIVRAVGLTPAGGHATVHSSAELRLLVEQSGQAGVLDAEEQEMLINVFSFANRPAHQAMRPRPEVVTIDHDATIRTLIALLADTGHTRLPVIGPQGIDDVQGIVSGKDLFMAQHDGMVDLDAPITSLIRPAFFTPVSKRIGDLLQEMRGKHIRMAILVDEYGGMAGIVTMEDLVEDIVGELADEGEADAQDVQTIDERTSIVEGQVRVEDINEELHLNLPKGDYETVAGMILTHLGHIPNPGESLTQQGVRLTVLDMQGPRIARIEIVRV